MADALADTLPARFEGLTERPSSDHPAFNVPAASVVALLRYLRDEKDFDMLVDLTAIDNGVEASPRFTVVYHLFNTHTHAYVRVASDVQNDLEPEFPSVVELWPAADWHERECYDMFGITFDGHPDLRRILMWDGYPYFPLRKDFPLAGEDTELPDPEVAEETQAMVQPAPMMGGPFVADRPGHMSENEPRAKDQSWTESTGKPKRVRDEEDGA